MMIKRPLYHAFHDLVSFVRFKKREDTHGGVLLLEPARVFLTFFSLYKWYQIAKIFQSSQCSPTPSAAKAPNVAVLRCSSLNELENGSE